MTGFETCVIFIAWMTFPGIAPTYVRLEGGRKMALN